MIINKSTYKIFVWRGEPNGTHGTQVSGNIIYRRVVISNSLPVWELRYQDKHHALRDLEPEIWFKVSLDPDSKRASCIRET